MTLSFFLTVLALSTPFSIKGATDEFHPPKSPFFAKLNPYLLFEDRMNLTEAQYRFGKYFRFEDPVDGIYNYGKGFWRGNWSLLAFFLFYYKSFVFQASPLPWWIGPSTINWSHKNITSKNDLRFFLVWMAFFNLFLAFFNGVATIGGRIFHTWFLAADNLVLTEQEPFNKSPDPQANKWLQLLESARYTTRPNYEFLETTRKFTPRQIPISSNSLFSKNPNGSYNRRLVVRKTFAFKWPWMAL